MRTLFVTYYPAFPPISGADLRNWQNACAAHKLGAVTTASLLRINSHQTSDSIAIEALTDCDENAIVWGRDERFMLPPGTEQRLEILARSFRPDAIVLESLPMGQLAGLAKRLADRIILDQHNVESHLIAQEAPRWSWLNLKVARRVRRRVRRTAAIEAEVIVQVDRVWVCSALDRDRVSKLSKNSTSIHVVPNGIPRPHTIPTVLPSGRGDAGRWPRLLFCGNLSYSPNVEAAHMLADLMPSVWQRLPDACLILAGRNPHPDVIAMSRPGRINVLPDPVDIDAILRDADMVVVPLLRGGGTRIKILEAMAWGLPVIATSRAVEGLGFADSVHFKLADTKADFVSQIEILSKDPKQFELVRTAARQFVQTQYGPEAIESAVKCGLQDDDLP